MQKFYKLEAQEYEDLIFKLKEKNKRIKHLNRANKGLNKLISNQELKLSLYEKKEKEWNAPKDYFYKLVAEKYKKLKQKKE